MAWVKQNGKWGVIGLSQDIQGISASAPKETITDIEASVSDKDGVRMRQGPGTDFDVIGMVPNKKKVTICGRSDDWTYIKVGSNYGWVKSSLLGVNLTKVSKYDTEQIKKTINDLGFIVFYGNYRYDNASDLENILIQTAVNIGDNKYENGHTVVSNVKKTDQKIYDDFHIKISHKKSSEQFGKNVLYKDKKYHIYQDWGRGDGPYTDIFKIKTVNEISSNLIFILFSHTIEYDEDIDKPDETSYDSAVIYTGASQYALVEYQKGKQTLSAERYLHYLNDFE